MAGHNGIHMHCVVVPSQKYLADFQMRSFKNLVKFFFPPKQSPSFFLLCCKGIRGRPMKSDFVVFFYLRRC